MFIFMLLLAFLLILSYFVIRFFSKNKAAKKAFEVQFKSDTAKLKKSAEKRISSIKNKF